MNDIICPNCKKVFKVDVDQAGFADIIKQVRDHQFDEELQKVLKMKENEKDNAIKLAEANYKSHVQEIVTKKDSELTQYKINVQKEVFEKLTKKEADIAELKAKIEKAELDKQLSVSEAVKMIEKERDALANEIKNKETEKQFETF